MRREVKKSETSHKPDSKLREVPQRESEENRLYTHHTLSDKEKKNLTILELIRKNGPISRAEISKITEINIVSISNYVKEYISKKIVMEKGVDVSTGGRRPELIELNAAGIYVIGVDISHAKITAILTDLSLKVIEKLESPVAKGNPEEILTSVCELIQELIKKSKCQKSDISAIGFGISDAGLLALGAMAEKWLEIEAYVGSDAACAAFGEKMLNKDADVEDLLYMHSDIGCGIVIKGDIYFGAGGSAGGMQFSSENISKEEESVFLEDLNYLRPWSASLGIIEAAKREVEKGVGTKVVELAGGSIDNITKEVIVDAALQNDDIALEIIKGAGMNLGVRIAYLVNLFNPETVVIGGGIEKAGELILEPIRKVVRKLSFAKPAGLVRIIPSNLGKDAVALGAAALVRREIFLKT